MNTGSKMELDPGRHQVQREWTAYWITPPEHEMGFQKRDYPRERYLFRKELSLDRIDDCALFITAGGRYELFVNSVRVTEGPPSSQPYCKFYDEINLTGHLQPGKNCVALVLHQLWDEPQGLLLELLDRTGNVLLQSDDNWRMTGKTGWRGENAYHGLLNTGRQEVFDANLQPQGWQQVGFDDSTWSKTEFKSHVGEFPWYRMVPRGIPLLEETTLLPAAIATVEEGMEIECRDTKESLSCVLSAAGQPITYSVAENVESLLTDKGSARFCRSLNHLEDRAFDGIWCPSVVLDFGRVNLGYLEIEVEGPEGAVVEIGYVERLLNGHFNNAIQVPLADRYTLRSGKQTFRCSNFKTFRFVKLRFRNCSEPVAVKGVRAISGGYPYKDKGAFQASDKQLEQVFEISRNTLRIGSWDIFSDSFWRENTQWLGDVSGVMLGGVYACFGDTAMPRKFLFQGMLNQLPTGLISNQTSGFCAAGNGRPSQYRSLATYSLWWVRALWEHYLYTGDRSLIDEGYPVVTQILQFHFYHLNRHGILTGLREWGWFDHVFQQNRKGKETAIYCAFFHGILEMAGQIAALKNDQWLQDKIREVRGVTKANFHERFFDAETGLYADCRDYDGNLVKLYSEHTNMAAIRWDLCPPELTDAIVDKLYLRKDVEYLEAIPFATAIILRALDRCGRMDVAIDLVRERWGKRMVDKGMTSVTEEWNASGSWRGPNNTYYGIFRSLSHAWSAFPAEFLTRHLAGLKIIEPGCGKVQLSPYEADFDYHLVYPTPLGDVTVDYANGQANIKTPDSIEVVNGA